MTADRYVRPTQSTVAARPPGPISPPAIAPVVPAAHVVDLMTVAGSAVFSARWKGVEAKIVECPALSDSMPEFRTTYDIDPHAEILNYDDSAWPEIAATDLGARRGGGLVSFFWFRATLAIPGDALGFAPAGTKVVLTVNIDDYAEVWVNGALPRTPGMPSAATIQGFNIPNRVVLTDSVAVGDKFEIAVFAINGPISAAPANFLWFREAKVEFYR